MKIQSLSVVVPTKRCINDCKFCVSKMHNESYDDAIGPIIHFWDGIIDRTGTIAIGDYIKRLEFVRDAGCNTAVLTGTGEPQQNMGFIDVFCGINTALEKPFRKIEMQTTGVGIDGRKLGLLRKWGVSTISLSISSFNGAINAEYNGTPEAARVPLVDFCKEVKDYGFTLRLSVNLTDWFNSYRNQAEHFFYYCKEHFLADQVTLRVLYADGDTPQAQWIRDYGASQEIIDSLNEYAITHGRRLEKLEYGYTKYSVNEMGIVVDTDCMSTEASDTYKYLILRPDCHLYSKWDDKGSLVF